jgi:tetratricopeptide (TPR) repeat protein
MRPLTFVVLLFLCALPACAQDLSAALDAVRSGDLARAAVTARAEAARSNDPRAWHILGVIRIAGAEPAAAEEAFTRAIELGGTAQPTGLEEVVAPGSVLYERLRRQKTSVALSAGPAAARNNRAAARYLQGRYAEALEDADVAAVSQSDWGVPWANAALILLELNRLERAEASAKTAIRLGETGARVYTTLGEIDLALRRMDRAEESLREALQKDPDYPFALLAGGRRLRALGKAREAERSFTQALSFGPLVAVDSRFERAGGQGHLLLGSHDTFNLRALHVGLPSQRLGYRVAVQTDRGQLEGRENAYQQSDFGELTLSAPLGTFVLDYRFNQGGRPGAVTPVAGVTPQPQAWYDFRQLIAAWQVQKALAPNLDMLLHTGFRRNDVRARLAPGTPIYSPIQDSQGIGEMRFDLRHGRGLETTLGAAISLTDRERNGATPVEPLEQVLPAGRTTQLTAYLLHRRPLVDRVDVILGGVLARNGDWMKLQPVAQFALKVTADRSIRFSITPRVNDAVSNLLPVGVWADPPQENPIDRRFESITDANRDPTLPGARSRFLDFELRFGPEAEQSGVPELTLFHRKINDVNTHAADPRLAPALLLTPVTLGQAAGVESRIRLDLTRNVALRLWGRVQETTARMGTPTFALSTYPTQNPAGIGGIPNFPRFQASARLDWFVSGWLVGLEAHHVGTRPRAVTITQNNQAVTYVGEAPATTGIHLLFRRRAGQAVNYTLGIYNLAKASFYPGYPGDTTAVLGAEYRY